MRMSTQMLKMGQIYKLPNPQQYDNYKVVIQYANKKNNMSKVQGSA